MRYQAYIIVSTWEVIDIDYIVVTAFPPFPDHIKIKKAKTLQEERDQYVKTHSEP